MMGFFLSLNSQFKCHIFRYLNTQSKIAQGLSIPSFCFIFIITVLVFLYLLIVCLPSLAFKPSLIWPYVWFSAMSQGLEQCLARAKVLVVDPGMNVFFHYFIFFPACCCLENALPLSLLFSSSQTPIYPSVCCLI